MEVSVDLVLCPHCSREIPGINKDIHIARCARLASKTRAERAPPINLPVHSSSDGSAMDITRGEQAHSSNSPNVIDLVDDDAPSAPPLDSPHSPDSPRISPLRACPSCRSLNDFDDGVCGACGGETAGKWQCKICTFYNSQESSRCAMCSTYKNGEDRRLAEDTIDSSTGWTCSACTYAQNSLSSGHCEVCGRADPERAGSSGNRYESSASSSSSGRDSLIIPATVFGSVLGAGAAYLDNRSVFGGAVEGAGMGLMGGFLLDRQGNNQQQTRVRARRVHDHMHTRAAMDNNFGFNYERVYGRPAHAAFMGPDVDNMDYEQLYSRFGGPTQTPASTSTVAALPVNTLTATAAASLECPECAICLDRMVEGENVQTLPCLHRFHSDCSTKWLQQSGKCPVCKHPL